MNRNSSLRPTRRDVTHLQVVKEDSEGAPLRFDSLYDRFAPYVAKVTLHLLGDDTFVEDIVQEVFLTCFRKLDTLCNIEHARRWLVKVTVQKARRRLRKKKIAQFLGLSEPGIPEPSMPSVSANDRAAMTLLYSLLERVPLDCRLAWSLRYLEGAEILEVANALGCSPATAKRRIQTAQRKILGEDHA